MTGITFDSQICSWSGKQTLAMLRGFEVYPELGCAHTKTQG